MNAKIAEMLGFLPKIVGCNVLIGMRAYALKLLVVMGCLSPVLALFSSARTVGAVYHVDPDGSDEREFERYRATSGYDAHSIWSRPEFIDPERHDYRLKSNSPGANQTTDGCSPGARFALQ